MLSRGVSCLMARPSRLDSPLFFYPFPRPTACKITTFPQTHKGMDEISLFTEAQQPCRAIVDRCVGGHLLLHAGVPLRSTTCLKTHRPYGAGLPHHTPSRQRTTPPPLAVMADKDPPSPTPLGLTLVVASRHREEERRSDPFMPDSCKI